MFLLERLQLHRLSSLSLTPRSQSCSAVTLSCLEEVVGHLRPSGSPDHPVPPPCFKEIVASIEQAVQAIINSMPANSKRAAPHSAG